MATAEITISVPSSTARLISQLLRDGHGDYFALSEAIRQACDSITDDTTITTTTTTRAFLGPWTITARAADD